MDNHPAGASPNKKKRVWEFLYIAFTLGILVIIGLLDPAVYSIADVLQTLKPQYLLLALGSIIVFWFYEGLVINLIANYLYKPMRFLSMIFISMAGQYYNALTPFGSAEPFQAMYMKRYGIPFGSASSIMVIKSLTWSIGTLLVSGTAIAFNIGNPLGSGIFAVVAVGYLLNLAVLVMSILAMYKMDWITRIGEAILRFLVKIRIIKHKEKWFGKLHTMIEEYSGAMKIARSIKGKVFWIMVGTLVQFISLMSVTYFIYLAFGNTDHSYLYIVLLQSIVYISVSFFPTPGAAGASEGGFYIACSALFPGGQTYLAMLIWRGFTYYLNIIVGAAVVLVDSVIQSRKKT